MRIGTYPGSNLLYPPKSPEIPPRFRQDVPSTGPTPAILYEQPGAVGKALYCAYAPRRQRHYRSLLLRHLFPAWLQPGKHTAEGCLG